MTWTQAAHRKIVTVHRFRVQPFRIKDREGIENRSLRYRAATRDCPCEKPDAR
ncbi:MAG: hypothetical protein J7L16_09100 [Deltaproteobacteria bacterium]|nr:hypothetical protein [Deltaproteobacteria bacterium]